MGRVGGEWEKELHAQESSWEEAQTQKGERLYGKRPLDLIMECAAGSLKQTKKGSLVD